MDTSDLKIVILEDEEDRLKYMRSCLSAAFAQLQIVSFDKSVDFIDYLKSNPRGTLLISLDHDLPIVTQKDGRVIDFGTGLEVADYLATQEPVSPVIIHSTNVPRATLMQSILQDTGWHATRITPYGDLAWIEELWYPTVREILGTLPKS